MKLHPTWRDLRGEVSKAGGKRIRSGKGARELSTRAIAKLVGFSPSTVWKYVG